MSAAELSDIELQGREIYRQGTSQADTPISAFLGIDRTKLPASAAPCASCHGIDGRGRSEGGVVPSDITWSELTKRYGHEHDYGRIHPAYDDTSVRAAITKGIDSAGNKLGVVMPRYHMERDDIDALIAYLRRLEYDHDPGVSEQAVHLATLLPLSGPAASQGEAIRAVLTAFVQDLNFGGGVNGRIVDLQIIPLGSTPAQTVANVREALQSSEIFALVAIYNQDVDAELAVLLDDNNVPVVGVMTPTPEDDHGRSRYTFYLYAGSVELMRSLRQFALSDSEDEQRRQVVVGPDNDLLHNVADDITATGDAPATTLPYSKTKFAPTATAAQMHATDDVFFLGTAQELGRLLDALAAANTAPRLFSLASTVTPALLSAPAVFDDRILVAYPTLPGDVSDNGRQFYASLQARGELPAAHLASQISALAAARVLVEAMRRVGHALNREGFIAQLEAMNGFATGLTPPISFSLNRRIGALGAHIVRVDLDAGRLVPVNAWRSLK